MNVKLEYTLIKQVAPIIKQNKIVVDGGVGGLKLTYQVNYFKIHKILGFNVVGLFPFKTKVEVYLKPYKKVWDTKRNRLPKNYWGKKNSPLTGIWVRLKHDYKPVKRGTIPFHIDQFITNHDFIRYLNKGTEHFSIIKSKTNEYGR